MDMLVLRVEKAGRIEQLRLDEVHRGTPSHTLVALPRSCDGDLVEDAVRSDYYTPKELSLPYTLVRDSCVERQSPRAPRRGIDRMAVLVAVLVSAACWVS